MSQPKNRRRAARRLTRRTDTPSSFYIHVLTSGTTRNPLGTRARLDMVIAVCFGSAWVERDGAVVVDCENLRGARERRLFCDGRGFVVLRKVEKFIERRRLWRSTWRIRINAPLWSATWELRGPKRWVCVEAGEGFA